MAASNKTSANQLFGKISAYHTIVQQNLGKFLNKLSPYAKEYESTLDLILDILRSLGFSEERLVSELLTLVTGESSIGRIIEEGYHGSLNSLESKLSTLESKQEDDSFMYRLEDAVKVTISTILTSFLSCSVSPFIPPTALDKVYKTRGLQSSRPINIPTHILDFSNTLHVSPVSESGIYFYNSSTNVKYFKRKETISSTEGAIADIREADADRKITYTYEQTELDNLTDEEKKKLKKVVGVPTGITLSESETPPDEFIYIIRPKYTAESLYRTDDMNAFIWYVANRGDNYEEGEGESATNDVMYEYNKLAWDSRRINARDSDSARTTSEDWTKWLNSRKSYTGDLKFEKEEGKEITTLYPVLQMEPSEGYGPIEHLIVTFPAQRYTITETEDDPPIYLTRTIYKFNADYLRSIKIFNWKTIIMNMLYELNGISPIPSVRFNLSLSDEIIDAKLSTLILNTIIADDKEVDDSFYSFSNEDYSEALKRMELRKYNAKAYETASSAAIQNDPTGALNAINETSTAATLNELTSTITRGAYSVAGSSGSTGITKTTLSASLAFESNFVYELLLAIIKPFVRALLSPQIMLLFCINLDVMGLINLKDLGRGDMDAVSDFIFRKLSAIIKKLIIQIKDAIVLYLFEEAKKAIKKLIDEIIILILIEQLNDYMRLLTQILECLAKFGIGITVNGIDDVRYADIIPELKSPENE